MWCRHGSSVASILERIPLVRGNLGRELRANILTVHNHRCQERTIASIRDGLLALLTQGPAYGLLLRNELSARTGRETPLNAGQVYATLERLLVAGLVSRDLDTEDGLPRFILTDEGASVASEWLRVPNIDFGGVWESMRFQVMLARSLPGVQSDELVRGYREFWQQRLALTTEAELADGIAGHPTSRVDPLTSTALAHSAQVILATAALAWLDRVEASSDAGEPMQLTRPPRGRPAGPSRR